MRNKVFGLIALLAATASPALARAPEAPRAPVITNPEWVSRPTSQDLEPLFPDNARTQRIDGRGTIECSVALDGSMKDCVVVDESPAGYGFGEATVAAARFFRMKPRTVDGKPVDGARIRTSVVWKLDDTAGPDFSSIDQATALHCYGVSVAAAAYGLGDDKAPAAISTMFWGGIAITKMSEARFAGVAEADVRLRPGIAAAVARAKSNPASLRTDLEGCVHLLKGLGIPFETPPPAPAGG